MESIGELDMLRRSHESVANRLGASSAGVMGSLPSRQFSQIFRQKLIFRKYPTLPKNDTSVILHICTANRFLIFSPDSGTPTPTLGHSSEAVHPLGRMGDTAENAEAEAEVGSFELQLNFFTLLFLKLRPAG